MRFSIWRSIGVLVGLAAVLSGCGVYNPKNVGHNDLLVAPYRMDTGDQVRVTVFDQRNLSSTYVVDSAGYIAMPLIGAVPARGRTTHELEGVVATKLRAGFLRDPDVSAEIATHRPFFILGEVRNAGQYPFVSGMTVQTAIAIAGGFSARASKHKVHLSRRIQGKIYNGDLLLTDPIRPGDTIYVKERWF